MTPHGRRPGVLLLSSPDDLHSFAVALALQIKGADAILWHTADFPRLINGSIWVDDGLTESKVDGAFPAWPEISSVWFRRPMPPTVPEFLDPADRPFAAQECKFFLRSLLREVGDGAFWVNPLPSIGRAELKPQQLRAAKAAGFKIPATLCSNDPKQIREFVQRQPLGAIYKSFFPVSWELDQGVAVLFSSVVRADELPEDNLLRASPGIFQSVVKKRFELRITCMGRSLFAAKLGSQAVASARIDWRAASEPVSVEPFGLPDPIARQCLQVMADLGLVFGCFDIIVTPDGEYVFLEVNEAGSFLWLEEQNPELRLLDAFSQFLIEGTAGFVWRESRPAVRLKELHKQALGQMSEASTKHVQPERESWPDRT